LGPRLGQPLHPSRRRLRDRRTAPAPTRGGIYERNIGAIRSFAKAGFKTHAERDYADDYDRWITCAFAGA